MALKKGINIRHGMQFGDRGATSASELAYDANTTTKQKIDALATEVSGKQDALTFDDTPTDGSNNPVKSNGVYDALATKANTDMVAADFNAGTSYTAGNYCIYEGKFYKFKNNHSGAWSAADVDEIKIAGELSSLMSGLNNVAGKMITVLLEYSSADSYFPITGDTPEPVLGGQITLVGRNIRNSAIYALWYDTTVKAFRVGGTIVGDAPQNGDSLYVQYIA